MRSSNGANEQSIMTRKTHLVLLALAAVFLGFAAGRPLFLPALKLLFADWTRNLVQYSDAERAGAAWNFSLGFSLLSVMVPLSAMVTERFAARARYSRALMKSLLVGALAFGAALFYQFEHFASRERLAAKMPQLISHLTTQLSENPLAKIVWFTAVCLVIFGPLDLWIAHLQKQWRNERAGMPPQQKGS
jgi:MFS family permease